MARMRPPSASRPRSSRAWTQATKLWPMTSEVMWICLGCKASGPSTGRRVPNAKLWNTTCTWASGAWAWSSSSMACILAGLAALPLHQMLCTPVAWTCAFTCSARGRVERRSRWMAKRLYPSLARAMAVAAPKPDDAPRTTAQRAISGRRQQGRLRRPWGPQRKRPLRQPRRPWRPSASLRGRCAGPLARARGGAGL